VSRVRRYRHLLKGEGKGGELLVRDYHLLEGEGKGGELLVRDLDYHLWKEREKEGSCS
jgi:hypothetical protein